jgi:uncharacterized damage-inducible protein DinB
MALAERVEQANNTLIAAVEQISEADWRKQCASDDRPLGVVVHHVAEAHAFVLGAAQAIAAGGELPTLTWEMVHAGNAEHARQHAGCDKAATLELLRRNSAKAARAIRGLSDEQLSRAGTWGLDGQVTAQQVIELHMIDHVREHLANIEAAIRVW